MAKNVLLIVVDCLRLDHATDPTKMPFLAEFGQRHFSWGQQWATSHCTDPSITHMLSGRHPDSIPGGLYGMMWELKEYTIPESVVMLAEEAARVGFHTGMASGLGRWYERGVEQYISHRDLGFAGRKDTYRALLDLPTPWFNVWHLVGMHTPYEGGSYDAAARAVDGALRELLAGVNLEQTWVVITADHGEGLGERGIPQHGYGLWDFLTHVPLLTNWGPLPSGDLPTDHGTTYQLLRLLLGLGGEIKVNEYVFQVGDTPPASRHRGIVDRHGSQFIRYAEGNQIVERLWITTDGCPEIDENLLVGWCNRWGIDYTGEAVDQAVLERLAQLGYYTA